MRRLAPLLVLLMLLSGCAADDPGSPDAAADASGAGDAAAASGSAEAGASSSPSQAPRPSAQPQAAASAAPRPSSEPVVGSCDAGTALGVGAGDPATALFITVACTPGPMESASGLPFRSAVVEMAWSNAAPTLAEAEFTVLDGEREVGSAKGAESPIRLVVSGDRFPADAEVELGARFGGTGVFADFQATFTFSLYELAEPPA